MEQLLEIGSCGVLDQQVRAKDRPLYPTQESILLSIDLPLLSPILSILEELTKDGHGNFGNLALYLLASKHSP